MALITDTLPAGSNNHPTTIDAANGFATDFVNDGVTGAINNTNGSLVVLASNPVSMVINIGSGKAYVTASGSGVTSQRFRVNNTSNITQTITPNSTGGTRWDWVYLALDSSKLANPNANGTDVAGITVVRSTSSTVQTGTIPSNSIALAVVTVANNATVINQADISSRRLTAAITGGAAVFAVAYTYSTVSYAGGAWRRTVLDDFVEQSGGFAAGAETSGAVRVPLAGRYRITYSWSITDEQGPANVHSDQLAGISTSLFNTNPPEVPTGFWTRISHWHGGTSFASRVTCERILNLTAGAHIWPMTYFGQGAAYNVGGGNGGDGQFMLVEYLGA